MIIIVTTMDPPHLPLGLLITWVLTMVVAVSEYQFVERPSFVWRYLENIDTVVTSIPLDPLALLPVHDQVSLFVSFDSLFLSKSSHLLLFR